MKKLNNYVVFDIDTTGLNIEHDYVNNIFAIKVIDGKIKDTISACFGYNSLDKYKHKFIEFAEDLPLITYSKEFSDCFFKLDIDNEIIDITKLSRELYPDLKRHSLCKIAEYLQINYDYKKDMTLSDYGFLLNEIYIKMSNDLLDKEIKNYIINNKDVSISSIQRKFLIGVNRAKKLIDSVR